MRYAASGTPRALGAFLQAAARAVTVQVFLDDISLSTSDDLELLRDVYDGLLQAVEMSGFAVNERKSARPSPRVELFHCSLEQGRTAVLPERLAGSHAEGRDAKAVARFERYCLAVEEGNVAT